MKENQKGEVTQYLVPSNVSTRFEFFPGFGWGEFKIVLISCSIGAILFFLLGLIKKTVYIDINNIGAEIISKTNKDGYTEKVIPYIPSIYRSILIFFPGVTAFFMTKRDPSNGMSLSYTIKSIKEFNSKQKLYLYKYNSGTED